MHILLQQNAEDLPARYDRYLFNRPEYLKSYGREVTSFWLYNTKLEALDGEVHFVTDDGKAVSPYRASFGSFQLAEGLKAEQADFFAGAVEEELKKKGVQSVRIRSYPFCYDSAPASLVTAVLLQQGYTMSVCDTNFHIPVADHSFFYRSLRQSERARINAAVNAGMLASINLRPDLAEVYDILLQCREEKGYPFRISFSDFVKMFEAFPGHYHVFEVRQQGKAVAVAVTIKINRSILYNFHIGQLPGYRKASPAVLLLKEIYSYAVSMGFKQLDLGIGSDSGEFNFPLINFKQNMGGLPSLKPLFEKELA